MRARADAPRRQTVAAPEGTGDEPGERLSWREVGNPAGPPAVLVHGFMSSNLQWEPNLERLGRVLRLVLVEQPGHGDSPTPPGPDAYSPPALLRQLEGIRRQLRIDRWWLIGHSMGGAVCLKYALNHPGRVHGLVFTNSRAAFGIDTDPPRRGEGGQSDASNPPDLRRLPFHPIHAKRFPEDLKQQMVEAADAMDPSVIALVAEAAPAWNSRDRLGELSVPTLLVNGRWESRFQPALDLARAAITDLEIVDLEGGHSINIEQAAAFDAAVLRFIREVTIAGSGS